MIACVLRAHSRKNSGSSTWRRSGATLMIGPKDPVIGIVVVVNELRRTILFMQVRPTFDANSSFDYIKIKVIPSCQSCDTRSRKLAQRMEIDPSNADDENSENTNNSGAGQEFQVRQAW